MFTFKDDPRTIPEETCQLHYEHRYCDVMA
jgi:hypothetical protein